MVKCGADTWNVEEPNNNFTQLKNLHISAPLEVPSQEEPNGGKRKEDNARLLAQMPASRVSRNPVATTDRSGRTQCQAEKTGIVEQVTRWQDSKTGQKGDHPHLGENHSA